MSRHLAPAARRPSCSSTTCAADDPGLTLDVAGSASGNIDISEMLAGALPIYMAVVIGLSLAILIMVFRWS